MISFLSQPWPWHVAGPAIGLMVPLLLLLSGKSFGVSSSMRHTCAAVLPGKLRYFAYDWKKEGTWNLAYVAGILVGGVIAGTVLSNPEPIAISSRTVADLAALGISDFRGLAPVEIFSWSSLATAPGLIIIGLGGFLLGFGARYAGGCTSGHGITGLATFEWRSLVAVIGFFIGGFFITYLIYPIIL